MDASAMMEASARIEAALEQAIRAAQGEGGPDAAPPRLAAALRYAVFPGGARIRPRLCLGVAAACGGDGPEIALAAASAIELLHCASLVHDDLPCFDDAATRRGRPSVHVAHGEPLAVLAGDALIVLAFETLARACASRPERLAPLVTMIASCVGMPSGITAGQGWESEANVDLSRYHRSKTGALFAAATLSGAIASGVDGEPWRRLGECLGEAYQVADDLHDMASEAADIGKPVGQDAAHGRASAVLALGIKGAIARLETLVAEAIAAIPACPGSAALEDVIRLASSRFVPRSLARVAA